MIVDCFTFFNELDLLECRLKYLDKHVDAFVLVESNISFSGLDKPYYFEENKSRYDQYLDRIIHIKIEINARDYDWTYDLSRGAENASWQVEKQQRNSIAQAFSRLPDSAVILVGDLDEIPNCQAITRATRLLENKAYVSLETRQFYYNLSQCLVELWPATVITRIGNMKRVTPQQLRDSRQSLLQVKNGGWHLTYFSDARGVREKIKSFSHREFDKEQFTNLAYIDQKIKNGEELYGRPFPMIKVNPDSLPIDFKVVFSRYLPKNTKLS